MKTLAFVCAAVMLLAATASAGDLAVSKSTLNRMGLGDMQTMSDRDGSTVRGQGVSAAVWGGSQANWFGGQHAENHYAAGALWLGPVGASASGNSFSFAGKVEVLFAADPTGFALLVHAAAGFAGGSASATAM
jgi:hypothetical protein